MSDRNIRSPLRAEWRQLSSVPAGLALSNAGLAQIIAQAAFGFWMATH